MATDERSYVYDSDYDTLTLTVPRTEIINGCGWTHFDMYPCLLEGVDLDKEHKRISINGKVCECVFVGRGERNEQSKKI